jgi:signal transduction histidine kinase
LRSLLEESVTELDQLYRELRVTLTMEAPVDYVVSADERMLRQSLLNILRNAAEAIAEDSDERSVRVRLFSEQDELGVTWRVVEVKDTGIGIPTAQLRKLFIPFFTTKSKGHGVGLALTHRVITQHGGTLTAANSTEGGALFTIKLPCDEGQVAGG